MNKAEALRAILAAYPHRTELHAHTFPVSSCSEVSARETVRLYAGLGYSAVCITNHLSRGRVEEPERWLEDFFTARAEGERLGVNILLGAEVRLNGCGNHYLLYGITPEDIPEIFNCLDMDISEFSRRWRGDDRALVHAHPLREGLTPADFSLFDAVEAFNAHPEENSEIALSSRSARGFTLTAGTDCHCADHAGLSALRSSFAPKTSQDIAGIIKSGDYVLEIGGKIIIP